MKLSNLRKMRFLSIFLIVTSLLNETPAENDFMANIPPLPIFYRDYHETMSNGEHLFKIEILCGGIPVHKRWVVISGRCRVTFYHKVVMKYPGEIAIDSYHHQKIHASETYSVESIIQVAIYGVKLVKLSKDIPPAFMHEISPDPIPSLGDVNCTTLQWTKDFKKSFVAYEIRNIDECEKIFLDVTGAPMGLFRTHDRCFLYKDGPKTACTFDIGGPMWCDNKLMGIINNSPYVDPVGNNGSCSEPEAKSIVLITSCLHQYPAYADFMADLDSRVMCPTDSSSAFFYQTVIVVSLLPVFLN